MKLDQKNSLEMGLLTENEIIFIGLPRKVFEWFISNSTKSHRADSSAGLCEGKTMNTLFVW